MCKCNILFFGVLYQAMKNLVFIAEVLKDVKEIPGEEQKQQLSLLWLIRRFRKLINTEIAQAPGHTQVVSFIYR